MAETGNFSGGDVDINIHANLTDFSRGLLQGRKEAEAFYSTVSSRLTLPSQAYRSLKLNAQEVQNLSYQINDLAVQLASGASPFVAITQQGAQITQIFQGKAGVGQAIKAVGTAITTFLLNPLTLAVVGFAVAAQAASFLWDVITNKGKSAEDVYKRQAEVLKEIKTRTDLAAASADQYGFNVNKGVRYLETRTLKDLTKNLQNELSGFTSFWGSSVSLTFGFDKRIQDSFKSFQRDIKEGTVNVEDYVRIWQNLAETDPKLQKQVDTLIDVTAGAATAADAVKEFKRALDELKGYRPGEGIAEAAKYLEETTQELREATNEMTRTQVEISGLDARNPAEKAAAARRMVMATPLGPNQSAEARNIRANAAAMKAYAEATHSLADAARDRALSLNESVIAAQKELELIGQGVGATARLRMENSLLADLRKEAARNNTSVSEEEVANIKRIASEVGSLTQKYAEANAMRDLVFQANQFGMNDTEKNVANTLRTLYGDDWKNYVDGAIAEQVRFNDQISYSKETFRSFLGDIKGGLEQGKNAFQAFGDSVLNVVDKITNKLLDQLVDALFQVGQAGAGFGGSGVGGGIGGWLAKSISGLFGGLFGGTAAVAHSGGLVGSTGFGRRKIPRLHQGLASDEMFAILQKGERVIPRNGGGGGSPNINFNLINATGEKVTARQDGQPQFNGREWAMNVVIEALGSPRAQPALRAGYGATPLKVGRG